ncbi:NUBPL iron-transfer P-loop NTPase [Nocardia tenerifensis]|uniref:NUBPL iron-transfer P-loop NTPase n=1 Tax=Nocardia tenerifensis TaxID=228006 RepID=A0A318K809_9NOCA|nr:SCO2523 family variant P-loop protein [Nocardia tenerifensis]PXX65586.1 NUBPL iron-transfer P-loop NTPase [Nocardia tenerifensis]
MSERILVFSTSDKGGTGRSVTSCNIAYRLSVQGYNVAYLDFDFGSPTSGALFEIDKMDRGVTDNQGLHRYLTGKDKMPTGRDIRSETNRKDLHALRHPYQLTLFPGDRGGGEFAPTDKVVKQCIDLLTICKQDYDVTFVDLSAGRSAALEIVLRATAAEPLRESTARWLVFHRWTRQHILAANGLVHGPNGILVTGAKFGHEAGRLLESVRYVRTAVPSTDEGAGDKDRGPQWAWLRKQNEALEQLAQANQIGLSVTLGTTPVEPVLQWREQVILDADVDAKIANKETVDAFEELAEGLIDKDGLFWS